MSTPVDFVIESIKASKITSKRPHKIKFPCGICNKNVNYNQ